MLQHMEKTMEDTKRVLILGGTGFIGINLTMKLLRDSEYKITVYGRNYEKYPKELYDNKRVTKIKGDFGEEDGFDEIVKGHDIVYHLVSTTVPTTSNKNVAKEITDNIERTSVLLESCVKYGVKRFIFISSGGTVYGIANAEKRKEEMQTNPINSYGLQKLAIEKLLYLYSYMHGLDYRIIRLANPYGPYQKVNGIQGVISTFIYKALCNEELTVYGDGSVVRDYIYIDDAIQAIVNIAESNTTEKLYNVGSGEGLSLSDIIAAIQRVLQIEIRVRYVPGRSVDVPINVLDIEKYERDFGRMQKIGIMDGIQYTAEFLMEHLQKENKG